MEHILLVSGTRPEIIKLAPVYRALQRDGSFRVAWLHTGQHGDMARQILECFDIAPDIELTRQGSSLAEFSVGCRTHLERAMSEQRWSAVIVQGDTESAFIGALVSFYNQVPVGHVEAGLRTYNPARPFPEEGLRQMIAHIAQFHFVPTDCARAALLSEAIPTAHIHLAGNTVIDAQQWMCRHKGVHRRVAGRGHLLVTMHRRENWGRDLEGLCHAIADVAGAHPDLTVLFPVHLNPVIQRPVHEILAGHANVRLVASLDYLAMQQALADAWLVLTDSGGLQEEAPTFRVPVLVLRNQTERREAVDGGCAVLIGTDRSAVVKKVEELWRDEHTYRRMQKSGNPFGDGAAAERIVAFGGGGGRPCPEESHRWGHHLRPRVFSEHDPRRRSAEVALDHRHRLSGVPDAPVVERAIHQLFPLA
jgi:UDP-N-acetylglucosamine 2-epimerase (non-hydrolysing)